MSLSLPVPGMQFDFQNEAEARATIEREDVRNLKRERLGTFSVADSSGAGLTLTTAGAWYRRLNGVIDGKFSVTWPVTANGAGAVIGLTGLPPTTLVAGGDGAIVFFTNTGFYVGALINSSAATISLFDWAGAALTNAQLSAKSLGIALLYNSG